MTPISLLCVALGGGAGAACRAALSNWIKARWHGTFPIATFCINIIGSFALGLLAAASLSAPASALCVTGFLGGFTTFSTLHVEAIGLMRSGRRAGCAQYLFASYLCGIAAAIVGLALGSE